jgi:hypothetical protein
MREGFARVDQDLRDLRIETRDGFQGVRAEVDALRRTMLGVGGGIILTLLAALLARGL